MNLGDLLPVAVFDAGVTDGGQNGQVLLELVYLAFETFGHAIRPRKIRERFGQLMHGPPHGVQLIRDFLGIQVSERT